jgi:hypothetical protein
MQNPVGSQSTLTSEIEYHRPVAIEGPRETMLALVRLRDDAYPSLSLIRQLTYQVQSVLEIKLKSLIVTIMVSKSGWVRKEGEKNRRDG